MKKLKIALLSPDQNPKPSTFIQAHKDLLAGDIDYYYKDWCPTMLENHGRLFSNTEAILYLFRNKILRNPLTFKQQALLKMLAKRKPDVIFAEYGITGVKALPICIKLNIPLVVIFHGADAHRKEQVTEYQDSYKKLFDYAQGIIGVSKFMGQKLMEMGCPQHKLVWTPCAPNDSFFEIKNTCSRKNFISVGRFVDKKSPQSTLEAFSKLLQKHPDSHLDLFGDGGLLDICKKRANDLNINDFVTFHGAQSPDIIRQYMSNALAFLQHSVTAEDGDSEGTPVAVLEAGAASLPVITTYHAGIPDVVQNNITGYLVKEHDIDDMVSKMDILASDFDKVRTMGEAARVHIKNNFSMHHHIETINQTLQKAVA